MGSGEPQKSELVGVPASRIKARLERDLPSLLFCPAPAPSPVFIEMAARAGYQGMWIDHEHQTLTDRELENLCLGCRAANVDGMIRVRRRDEGSYFRALELGAHGVMLPHCNTPQEAEAFVRQLNFPPLGNRSLGGGEPHSQFARVPMTSYPAEANRQTFVVVQIEEPDAVDRAEEIAAVEGVDVLFVGPGDLALRYQAETDPAGRVAAAIERVAQVSRRQGKHWGIPPLTVAEAKSYAQRGARLLGLGSVYSLVHAGLLQTERELRQWLGHDL